MVSRRQDGSPRALKVVAKLSQRVRWCGGCVWDPIGILFTGVDDDGCPPKIAASPHDLPSYSGSNSESQSHNGNIKSSNAPAPHGIPCCMDYSYVHTFQRPALGRWKSSILIHDAASHTLPPLYPCPAASCGCLVNPGRPTEPLFWRRQSRP